MSPSSSDSWCGARGADIIDLDRYMRGNVRPSRTLSADSKQFERLVVDAGGVSQKPRSVASGSHGSYDPEARLKRYSHDSGVSDGSYQRPRRTHRSHRRISHQDGSNMRTTNEPPSARAAGVRVNSSSSLRAFRAVCEQRLIEQQQQIARVAQLCEILTERTDKTKQSEKNVQNEQRKVCKESNIREPSEETSEISSSSCSTKQSKDERHKDKHRNQECKTYKIIMSKLDELSRLYSSRVPLPAPRPPRPARPAPRPAPSSTSVSVCDKLVATEPQRTVIVNRVMTPTVQTLRRNKSNNRRAPSIGSQARSSRHSRMTSTRAVTQAFSVDIAPRGLHTAHPNVVTESIVKCESSTNNTQCSKGDQRCAFDLEDPVHLYSQAKRLQALTAMTRRSHSVEPGVALSSPRATIGEHARSSRAALGEHARSPSLCAVCRAYCRYLRQHVVDPLFGRTEACS